MKPFSQPPLYTQKRNTLRLCSATNSNSFSCAQIFMCISEPEIVVISVCSCYNSK